MLNFIQTETEMILNTGISLVMGHHNGEAQYRCSRLKLAIFD